MPYRRGRKSAAQTPAPRSERIKGSKKNPKGTAASQSSASKIVLADKTIKALSEKAKDYNKKHKSSVSLNTLKAVFRRGAGAYSSSHRPTITGGAPNSRNAWAMARVNKFLMKKAGKKVKAAYVQDDDLLAKGGNVFDDKQLLKRYKEGKSIGFSAEAHLKAKGLLPRTDGTKRKSDKYKRSYAKKIGKTYGKGGKVDNDYKLRRDLQEFLDLEFYSSNKYSDVSKSCDLAKGNCYDISEELMAFLKNKGYRNMSLVEVRNPLFDLSDAHYEWVDMPKDKLFHIILKVEDKFIDLTGIQYSKSQEGLKIYTEEEIDSLWGKKEYFEKGGLTEGGFNDEVIVCSNCLWSWKASESTPEEKYICHKCGHDNTPTMDKITMDVPLFIRLLEFAREDAKTDVELHTLTENAIKLGDKTLTMQDYDKIVFSKITSSKIMESKSKVVEFPTIEGEFAEGGVVVGKRHSEEDEFGTGEKFLVESTGQLVELEGGEGVLCKESMQSKKIYKFDGKEMTGREIASYLNHRYGGVEFAKGGQVDEKSVCGCPSMYYHGGELPSATLDSLKGGEAVVTVKTMESKDKFSFQGRQMTPRKILSHINQESGGKKFDEGGIIDLTEHHLKNLSKMAKMVNFTEKILYL